MNQRKVTIPAILDRKKTGKKIAALTAYDYSFARILDSADIDLVLVGDSLGMVALGYKDTLSVTMEEMIHHTRSVRGGIHNALLVGDMPFMSYQVSNEEALRNAGRFVQEGGAEAVKIEGGVQMIERIRYIIDGGISVMGHIGLTPQSVHKLGGYRVQGKDYKTAKQIKKDAHILQEAGVFSIVLEGIPTELAAEITGEVSIPTVGIGAGPHCDGQILVLHDMLGLNPDFVPKYVKQFANLGNQTKMAIQDFIDSVRSEDFPGKEHSYHLKPTFLKLKGTDAG